MLTIKMKGGDGTTFQGRASNLQAATSFVESSAINLADDLWTGHLGKVFPLFWLVIGEDRKLIASGHVDEYGCVL